ncbi:hypothetical protein ES319_D05G058000v1 [Gossypium barbadense]|uniref:Transmembrane protein n=2 Tax=Gossypium TaxID=3633 RepID=A0A5J5RC63_GOSBA|nr:hypothetical protein ES319_D05G058000v1 [Gossypium barbadense]TYG67235.1 hypothetical protein ES288_D05G061900v1 [Gossypium darwinii]
MVMNLSWSLLSFSPVMITFLFLSTFLTFSHGVSVSLSPTPLAQQLTSGKVNGSEAKSGVELSWGITRRSVVEVPIGQPLPPLEVTTSSLALAAEKTYRKDPLNGFKRYTGGWDIRERHYWASVAYTAVPLFAIAAIWFVGFGLCLLLVCIFYFCYKRQPYGYYQIAYATSLVFLALFTIAAILGCIVLYVGQDRFHSSTTKTLQYVVNQADMTVRKLKDVSDSLATAKQVGVDKVFLPSNVQTDIDEIGTKINSSASTLADKTVDNSDDIRDLLDSVRVALIVIAAIMLVLTFLGLLFSIFGMQLLVYILVILGWLLVTGTFILCGTFLVLHNVAADTCVAMHDWMQNPTAHTALDDILPCVDNATTQETLLKSREVTSQLVEVINTVITNVSNINFSPNFPTMYFNQSGPLVPVLCNPFSADLTERTCTAGELNADNATEVWRNYVCQVSPTGICTTTGRITPALYDQMTAAVNVGSALYNYAPFLVQLQDCTFVRETFTGVYVEHCPGLRRYSRWVYIGLVMVSTSVMLSLIFWVIYGRERRHRLYTKQINEGAETNKDS